MSRTNEEAGNLGEFERGRSLWRRCQSADAPMDEAARLLDLAAFAEGLLDEEEHDRVAADLAADRAQVLETFPVSRETTARLDRFVALLLTSQSSGGFALTRHSVTTTAG